MLSPDQQETLKRFLNTKWRNKNCQLCNFNTWDIHGIVSLSIADQVGAVFGGPSLPMAAMLCKNCGHTVLVNLMVAGVLQPDPPLPDPIVVG
jgi:hypothetical protein